MHLASLVEDFRKHAPETAIVLHRGVRSYRTTYGELAQIAGRFAAELVRRGIGPGERVILWGENSAEWIGAFFGCLLRGALAVPIDASGSPSFAARILEEVTPRLIVGDAERLQAVETNLPTLHFSELIGKLPDTPNFSIASAVHEDALFQIIFTSGTTSEPKGVAHTHRNVLASLRPIEAEIGKYRRYERWVHPLRFLHTLPLSHVFGQFMGLWIPAVLSAEIHFTDALDSDQIVRLIRRERISVLVAVPRILTLLRTHLLALFPGLAAAIEGAANLSVTKRWWRFRAVHRAFGWKFWAAISGGASLPAELELFWHRLGFALIQGYGLTETAALVTLNHPFRIAQGSIGKALPGREVRVSDTGELLVRGEMVAGATWQGGKLQKREGEWLATGDLAEQNASGEFRFLGRTGDAIVSSSGLNIYPADLEGALVAQAGVQACVVVPCALEGGPEPVCVVIFHGDDSALQQAMRRANRELAEYQQIRRVLRWPDLAFPYTSSGKLLRRNVREWASNQVRAGAQAGEADDALLAAISSITGEPAPAGGDALRLAEDLHLDSLGRVQLASMIEQKTGVSLTDAEIAAFDDVGQLRLAIGASWNGADPSSAVSANAAGQKAGAAAAPRKHYPGHIYPRWPWTLPIVCIRWALLEGLIRPLIAAFFAPRVLLSGQPVPESPLLIIANHVTLLDGPLVLYALPLRLRRRVAIAMSGEMLLDFRIGGKKGWLRDPFERAAYWLLTAVFNVFPLPRVQGFRRSFAHAGAAMDRNYSVLVFPEGARSATGTTAPFRPGIGLLAAQAGVPVLPVALLGLEAIAARKARWFRSGRVEVRVGRPIPWLAGKSAAEWTAELEGAVEQLQK